MSTVTKEGYFTKTGGIIYGSGEGENSNSLTRNVGSITGSGSAVYCIRDIYGYYPSRREATAGIDDHMTTNETGTAGGWD